MGRQGFLSNATSGRAWRLLRLALLWARKGGLLKCRLVAELRHGAKYLKGFNNKHYEGSKDMIRYGERQLSFDDTPVIHLKMNRATSLRFIIPCIKPNVVDFNYDFGELDDGDLGWGMCGSRRSFLEHNVGDYDCDYDGDEEKESDGECENEDEGIDAKAEEFIAKFYQQIKLQREVSFQRKYHNNLIG